MRVSPEGLHWQKGLFLGHNVRPLANHIKDLGILEVKFFIEIYVGDAGQRV
jgi:hypothetical protein